LHRRLIELRRVRLMGVSTAMRPCHRDVDGAKDRDRSVHHGALEHAIATYACIVVSRHDSAGIARTADTSTDGSVVVAAIAANPRNLGRRLIKDGNVALVGRSRSMGTGLRDILRFECRI